MALSLRNARRAFAQGAVEAESRGFYLLMVIAHVLFLAAGPIEVLLLHRPFIPPIAIVATWIVVLTMALRYWAIATLGERWNTRVIVIPGLAAVAWARTRFVRHPTTSQWQSRSSSAGALCLGDRARRHRRQRPPARGAHPP